MIKPELTVAAIVERNGRFLMVEERVDGRTVLNQPAGHVEYGESFLDAVVRETREETGWRLIPTALVGLYLWRVPASTTQILRLCFCGDVDDHDSERELDDGIIAAHWLDERTLAAREDELRSPLVLRGIADYRGGHRHPLDLAKSLDFSGELRCASE